MSQIDELCMLFDRFSDLFDQMCALQHDKVQAVHSDDIQALDLCMQREQAMILQLRGFQRQKDALHKALGISGVPLRQVARHLPADVQNRIAEPISRFETAYQLYQSASAASRAALESALYEIEHQLLHVQQPAQQSEAQTASRSGNFTDIKA